MEFEERYISIMLHFRKLSIFRHCLYNPVLGKVIKKALAFVRVPNKEKTLVLSTAGKHVDFECYISLF